MGVVMKESLTGISGIPGIAGIGQAFIGNSQSNYRKLWEQMADLRNDPESFRQLRNQFPYGTSTGTGTEPIILGTGGPFIPNTVERIFYDPYGYSTTPDKCYKEPSDVVIVHVTKPIKVNLSLIN